MQDCGLIIDLKLAESQVYGALIMGVTYALFEEAVYDPQTGRDAQPGHGVLSSGDAARRRQAARPHDDRQGLRRARRDRPGRAAGDFAGRCDLERRGQRDRRSRADAAAYARSSACSSRKRRRSAHELL